MSDSWLPTNTLRLARLTHPGRQWRMTIGDTYAQALVERDLPGDVWIGFNADSLDDLAKVEAAVAGRGRQAEYAEAINAINCADCGQSIMSPAGSYYLLGALIRTPPDQRRRALIAVLDAHSEIENPAPVNGEDHED